MPEDGFNPDWRVHPGETLAEMLEERDLSVRQFADDINYSHTAISYIIQGKRRITVTMALAFERYFDSPTAEFWLNLQQRFDLHEARERGA